MLVRRRVRALKAIVGVTAVLLPCGEGMHSTSVHATSRRVDRHGWLPGEGGGLKEGEWGRAEATVAPDTPPPYVRVVCLLFGNRQFIL